jgi:DNA-binding MarR family transcriptional regulator
LAGRVFERLLREKGVDEFNGAQGRILYVLWEHGTLNITQIGRQTSLAKTTLTSMLNRMESTGLIKKEQDGKNKRQILVSLTVRAEELSRAYEEISERMNNIFYSGFTDEEITDFELKLERIISNLSQYERMKS